MKKSKSLLKSFLWLALYGVSYFLILFIMALLFKEKKIKELELMYPLVKNVMIEEMFQAFLKTNEFQKEFYLYLQSHLSIYTMLNLIPLWIFSKKYRRIEKEKKSITRDDLIQILILTSVFSLTMNMILSHFSYETVDLTIWYLLLSGFIGPITEELFFRGVLYSELQTSFSKKTSAFLMILLFAILHQNPTTMIYAFFMGIWFTYLFEKFQNIKISMFAHIIGNAIVPLMIPYIYIQTRNYKIGFLLLLFFIFLLTIFQIKNKENKE